MSERAAFDAFIDKWRARWPEWAMAEVFVPPAQRDAAIAWFALLQELADAAWRGDDPAPGLAKLAWWQEELRGWAKGARRHPLGLVLQPLSAPWQALAEALPVLRDRTLPHRGDEALRAALRPLGAAMAAVEGALFGGTRDPDALSLWLVMAHAGVSSNAWAPDSAEDVMRDASRVRRLADALLRLRFEGGAAGHPVSRWRTLIAAWRAARN